MKIGIKKKPGEDHGEGAIRIPRIIGPPLPEPEDQVQIDRDLTSLRREGSDAAAKVASLTAFSPDADGVHRRVRIVDQDCVPVKVVDLQDPVRNSIFVQLGFFILETYKSGRKIDSGEVEALTVILEKLRSLHEDCVLHGKTARAKHIKMLMQLLGLIAKNQLEEPAQTEE